MPSFDLGLNGVHVLISGAGSRGGIGAATVKAFIGQGARVSAGVNSTAAGLEGVEVSTFKADVTKEDEVKAMFESARAEAGGQAVQVLVVNHAYIATEDVPLAQMSLEQWRKTIDINLTGAFLLVREFLGQLHLVPEDEKHKVAVVLIGSNAGLVGEANHADYASSKGALHNLCLSLKNEIVRIAPRARCNVVAPGWVKTEAVAGMLSDPEVVYASLATTALRKLAIPEDVATQILAYASSTLSGHVTGQLQMVNGGFEGRLLNTREDLGL